MKLHHLRNATLVIETETDVILVDPMLGKRKTIPPFTIFRYKPHRNPLVALPKNSRDILSRVTICLITHLHPDHIDKAGEIFLRRKSIPVICSAKDENALTKRGLTITQRLNYWEPQEFLGGKITGIPAIHGYGFIAKLMGNVMGFYIELPNQKSIYISSDTIFTEHVQKVLIEFKPDIATVACGTARLDIGQPLLMRMNDILKFAALAPGKVFANHLEALNHCPTTRAQLKSALAEHHLLDKVAIPNDGTSLEY
ncbi:MBL fold metallo-hydrolase [Flavobacterium aquidurense]|jgi:L-ascorbate metabolism protein UlaG (beta-lactamase superfamily)|uniref:MBL fold metallo-hydrolase n=1 Tax=Flavobacterium aquidurense TaxID=362413 RepID=UPI00091A6F48|nr:MBL fold metallo-hydrolase [Flavobacterium aquidurense]OXA69452.1 MBL fold metallo-hydrolase [Flavobacterium aquidurense]SHH07820.1 Beta-lactamase superfamily domain-containing protein [Flavobacterium frigidimaris]